MRDTTTGISYEREIYNLLRKNNISYKSQVVIGKKRNGKGHRIDLIISKTLISLKHQQVEGTAEEKIPFEFMKLQHAVSDYDYDNSIIVLSGDTGWTWKNYYLSPEFKNCMKILHPDVAIMSNEEFISQYSLTSS